MVMSDELKRTWKWLWYNLKYCFSICVEKEEMYYMKGTSMLVLVSA
jgi:hypothetical protein